MLRASMGPRSDNRGYVTGQLCSDRLRMSASMGPRSDNRGYASVVVERVGRWPELQWVHGPITVVMRDVQ